jgi:hypothetical protein
MVAYVATSYITGDVTAYFTKTKIYNRGMMKTESGDKKTCTTFPVSSGLLTAKHVQLMGNSIWSFLWCIDRTTRDRQDGEECWGQVLGGYPVSQNRIAGELGLSERTVRTQLNKLQDSGYIRVTRCMGGQRIEVRNSIKWRRCRKRVTVPPVIVPPAIPASPVSPSRGNDDPKQLFGSLAEALRQRLAEREKAEGKA